MQRLERKCKNLSDQVMLAQQELDKATAASAAAEVDLAAARAELDAANRRLAEESNAAAAKASGFLAVIEAAVRVPPIMADHPFVRELKNAMQIFAQGVDKVAAEAAKLEAEAAAAVAVAEVEGKESSDPPYGGGVNAAT